MMRKITGLIKNLLSKVCEKYLSVFAMSTPDGSGTLLCKSR
jgi:hypothetical protein